MAKFHVACPITGQAVCRCDFTGGLSENLGGKSPKALAGAPLSAASAAQMWRLWQTLTAGEVQRQPEMAEVLVPRLYHYRRKQEDLEVDGMSKGEALEVVKVAELAAQQAALKAARAYASVGRPYTPPQGVTLPLGLLEVKESESVEALAEVVTKLQEELKAMEVEESRHQQARQAQQAQQAQQMKVAMERKQQFVKQYEAERMEVERREAAKREGERREKERRDAELRAESERQKEIERQRLEAERRVEAERREAERREAERREAERREAERREAERREAERRAEVERQQRVEVERNEREKERQKKMDAERERAEQERTGAESKRQVQAAAEEARRPREFEASWSERRRKSNAAEALASMLDEDEDWLQEEELDDDDEEFVPGTSRGNRGRRGGASERGRGSNNNSSSSFRALEKLADSSLLVSPRQPLGNDATLLRLPGSDDDFDDLPEGLGEEDSGADSPILAPGTRGVHSSLQAKQGGPKGKGAAAGSKQARKPSGGKKPGATTSLNDPRDRSGGGSHALNRVISTIPHKEKDAALQALRSVTKLPPGRTTTNPSGGHSNPLGKPVPTKPRDRTGLLPGAAKGGAGPPTRGTPAADKPHRPNHPHPSAPKPSVTAPRSGAPSTKTARNPPAKPPGGHITTKAAAKPGGVKGGKTLLKAKDFRTDLTGKTLMLLWPEDGTWWKGRVTQVDMKQHTVLVYYDTGEEETLNLLESINKGEVAWLAEGESPVPPPPSTGSGPALAPLPPLKQTHPAHSQRPPPPAKMEPTRKRKVPPSNPHRPNTHATGTGPAPPHEKKSRPNEPPHPSKPSSKPSSNSRTPPPKAVGGMRDDSLDSVRKILQLGSSAIRRMVEVYWEEEDIWFRGVILKVDDQVLTVEYLHGVMDELDADMDVKIKLLEKQIAN